MLTPAQVCFYGWTIWSCLQVSYILWNYTSDSAASFTYKVMSCVEDLTINKMQYERRAASTLHKIVKGALSTEPFWCSQIKNSDHNLSDVACTLQQSNCRKNEHQALFYISVILIFSPTYELHRIINLVKTN